VQHDPEKFLDHVTGMDRLFDVRIEFEGNTHRIFCCYDKGNLVVLINRFLTKSQKRPKRIIDLALKLKAEHFNSKSKNNE